MLQHEETRELMYLILFIPVPHLLLLIVIDVRTEKLLVVQSGELKSIGVQIYKYIQSYLV